MRKNRSELSTETEQTCTWKQSKTERETAQNCAKKQSRTGPEVLLWLFAAGFCWAVTRCNTSNEVWFWEEFIVAMKAGLGFKNSFSLIAPIPCGKKIVMFIIE